MSSSEEEIKKLTGVYNVIPSLFWSALLLVPISIFCYTLMNPKTFWIFLGISMLVILLPRSFFDSIQISQANHFYKKIGVGFVNRFTQNGDIINSLLRKRHPGYRVISKKKASIQKLISRTYLFEKFHFILFLFFLLVMLYASVNDHWGWAVLLLISNMIYNVYPAFLQQYIRVRLKSTMR